MWTLLALAARASHVPSSRSCACRDFNGYPLGSINPRRSTNEGEGLKTTVVRQWIPIFSFIYAEGLFLIIVRKGVWGYLLANLRKIFTSQVKQKQSKNWLVPYSTMASREQACSPLPHINNERRWEWDSSMANALSNILCIVYWNSLFRFQSDSVIQLSYWSFYNFFILIPSNPNKMGIRNEWYGHNFT